MIKCSKVATFIFQVDSNKSTKFRQRFNLENPQSFQHSLWCFFPECFVISNPVSYKHLEISNASVLATICDKFHQICVNNIRIDHKEGCK